MGRENSTNLDYFQEIEIKKPADVIIHQIRSLISSGKLKPGDQLPSERVLTERFGVGRGHIREALKKLEFYGILKTLPQKGTIVASLGVKALEGLIANILDMEPRDFISLMEVRTVLEVQACRLSAQRADEQRIQEIVQTQEDFRQQVESGNSGLEEDHLFHLKIAECSQNSVLQSLIGLITPDIIALSRRDEPESRIQPTLEEHRQILQAIVNHDPDAAAGAMQLHMKRATERRQNFQFHFGLTPPGPQTGRKNTLL